jgi:hypothetical protein
MRTQNNYPHSTIVLDAEIGEGSKGAIRMAPHFEMGSLPYLNRIKSDSSTVT